MHGNCFTCLFVLADATGHWAAATTWPWLLGDSPLEIKNTNQASSPDNSVSANDTADHSNNQDELSVHTAETSQSSDFDYANLGEDTQSDAESTSSVLDGLDSHFFF